MRGGVSARGARGECIVLREISERYLGDLDWWRWLSRLFGLWDGCGRGCGRLRLTRWIGEMLLRVEGCRFNPLRFLRAFRVREDGSLGGSRGSRRDHRNLLVNDRRTTSCRARTDDGGRWIESVGADQIWVTSLVG